MNRSACFLLLASMLIAACEPGPAGPARPGELQPEYAENQPDTASEPGEASAANQRQGLSGQASDQPTNGQAQPVKPNVIRWSTASEFDSFGYDIYRGETEDGPFEVINADVIPGAGTTDMPNTYEYIDDAVKPGTTYWYFIESISLTGERKRITPVYPSKRTPPESSLEPPP